MTLSLTLDSSPRLCLKNALFWLCHSSELLGVSRGLAAPSPEVRGPRWSESSRNIPRVTPPNLEKVTTVRPTRMMWNLALGGWV